MSLTDALRQALTEPIANPKPLWGLLVADETVERVRIGACLLLYGMCPSDPYVKQLATDIPTIAHAALDAGVNHDDLCAVLRATVSSRETVDGYANWREPLRGLAAWSALRRADDPNAERPAEWTAAATRLAEWADAQETP